ncbi:exported hypothetical protein [Mesorhizobium sp. SOD10]|nr:exported hypothetical protein [Mesorhizobium sp. SOD10]
MAFIAPLAGAAVGGGLLGSIVTTAVGVGINLAIAYFFPQKIKGPRAESLKAQTSRYGEQLTRWYGAVRTAGAVIWLKGDHVDEHVKKERQGKALGPEVTTYSYTATFAVAFAWNGPASGITRIWADDKLIFDVSFEALQNAIANGGKGIGVAKGASITLYLGTDDQKPDPDIEADRGAGQVPAWPGIVYCVIKNLPLDEFGIRVPNIEAEITQAQGLATTSVAPTTAFAGVSRNTSDIFGDYFANAGGTTLYIERLPTAEVIAVNTLPYDAMCVHITALNKVAVTYQSQPGMRIFDAATGAFETDISGVGPATPIGWTSMADISFGGVNYLFAYTGTTITMLSNIGTGYSVVWNVDLGGPYDTKSLCASASRLYGVTDWVFSPSKDIVVIAWDSVAPSVSKITLSALDDYARAAFYDVESDSVIIETIRGSLYVYTPDLGTLLRSKINSASVPYTDPLLSNRMKVASDQIGIKFDTNDIYIYRVSDLGEVQHIVAHDTSWVNKDATQYYFTGFNERWQTILLIGTDRPTELWYLPRAQRLPVPLADVIAAECSLAGLSCDASHLSHEIYKEAA